MKLVIVESPTKAKTIQKYLGNGHKVLASGGHIRDLPEKSFGVNVDKDFQPEYVVVGEKKDLIDKMKKAVGDCDEVYLATDPDREGEAISWHLSEVLNISQAQRVEFNEITQRAISQAMKSPRELNMNLVNAQQARRVLDRIVGYKISPVLNQKIRKGLSGGRVQSAALKLVVDREREITAFIPEEYWNIFAILLKTDKSGLLKAAFNDFNGKKLKVTNGEQAAEILEKLKTASYIADSVKRGTSKSRPAAPFTTSTLQQDASSRLKISAPEVMKLAQNLYEGVEIAGEGLTALVTYIRTDSVRVAPEAQEAALDFIKENFGAEYAPGKPNFYASKGDNVQDAHEAIRPISLDRTPESLRSLIKNNKQYRLYKLIYDRFLASQMTDAEYNTLKIHINGEVGEKEKYGFVISGKTLIFKGYTVAYGNSEKEDDEDETSADKLPNVIEGERLDLKEIKSEQKFTKPPARYTDATFIKAMEDNGIGRPATYATVVSILSKREYTDKDGSSILPTELGFAVTEFLEKNFPRIVDVEFTSQMESELDGIANGIDWKKTIGDFYPDFIKAINAAYSSEKKAFKAAQEVSDIPCDKCGELMIVRDGRFGKFLACPAYPACKNIKSIVESVGKCPECGGDVVKKGTKTGKVFYGCGNYPNCKFMSWDIPAPIKCPECGSTMKIVEKNGKTTYNCTNHKCRKVVVPENSATTDAEDANG